MGGALSAPETVAAPLPRGWGSSDTSGFEAPGHGGPRLLLSFNFFYQDFLLLPLPVRLLLALPSFLAPGDPQTRPSVDKDDSQSTPSRPQPHASRWRAPLPTGALLSQRPELQSLLLTLTARQRQLVADSPPENVTDT